MRKLLDGINVSLRRRDFFSTAIVGAGVVGAGLTLPSVPALAVRPKGPETTVRDRGLRCHLNSILWVTVNVSDLERSIEFYEETYPVTRAERTNGPAQAFLGVGIPHGQFEGRVMRDSQPYQGRAIHLVEWKSPGPVGEPYKEVNHVGYYRHHASPTRSGLQERYEIVLAAGGQPYGPPSSIFVTPTLSVFAFAFRDPDGTTLEYVGALDPNPSGLPDSLSAYNANCSNLPDSFLFYRDVMGLDFSSRLNPVVPQPPASGSLGDLVRNPDGTVYTGDIDYDAAIFGYRSDFRNVLDLLQFEIPGPFGEPYEEANHLGTVNVAWEVDDVEQAYRKLMRIFPRPHERILAPPETWDLGEFGIRKVLNFSDPDGIMIQLIERPRSLAEEPV